MKPVLLNMLACPKCCGVLEYDINQNTLYCQQDKLKFFIKDDIPVLLETEALQELASTEN